MIKKETNEWYLSPHKYFAFISYSHHDIDYARQIQKSLENYDITTIIESRKACHMTPICRDETDFTSGSLNNTIKTKLAQSKKLIVLCSKSAKNSSYVAQEVDFFIETFGIENVIPVLTEPFEKIDDILPGTLSSYSGTESELLCIDRFGFDHQDDKKVILQLIASILDIDYDTVYNRNQKRIKDRFIHKTIAVICVILALFLVAFLGLRTAASFQIKNNLQEAQEQRKTDISSAVTTLMEAKKLSRRWFIKNDNINILMNDILNYSEGTCLKVTDVASKNVVNETSYITNHEKTFLISDFQNGGRYSYIIDYTTGETLAAISFHDATVRYLSTDGSVRTITFDTDDNVIKNSFTVSFQDDVISMLLTESTSDDYSLIRSSVAAVNISTNEVYQISLTGEQTSIELSGNGFYFIENETLYFTDYKTAEKKQMHEGVTNYIADTDHIYIADKIFEQNNLPVPTNSFANMFVSSNNVYVLDQKLYAFDKATEQFKFSIDLPEKSFYSSMSFSQNGIAVLSAYMTYNAPYILFDESDGQIISELNYAPDEEYPRHNKDVISKDGTWLATPHANKVYVKNLVLDNVFSIECEREVFSVFFSEDNTLLYTVTADGRLRTWAMERTCRQISSDNAFIADGEDFYYISDNTLYRENVRTGKTTAIFTSEDYLFQLENTNDFVMIHAEDTESEDTIHTRYLYDKNTSEVFTIPNLDDYFVLNKEENIVFSYGDTDGEFTYLDLDTLETFTPDPTENITHGSEPVLYTQSDDGLYQYDFQNGFRGKKIADASVISSAKKLFNVRELKPSYFLLSDKMSEDQVQYFLLDAKNAVMTKLNTNTTEYCYIKGTGDDFFLLKSDNVLYKIDYETAEVSFEINDPSAINSVTVSKDVSYLVYEKQHNIVVEDLAKGTTVAQISYPENKIPASLEKNMALYYTFDETCKILHIGYYDNQLQKNGVLLYDLESKEYIADYEGTLLYPLESTAYYLESSEQITKELKNVLYPLSDLRIYRNVYVIPSPLSGSHEIYQKATELLELVSIPESR